MNEQNPDTQPATDGTPAPAALPVRALILFVNFLLVILAYYQVKAASRSLLLEHGGSDAFPYVWIGSAVLLLGFVGVYNQLVQRYSRLRIVLGSLFGFAALLCFFHQAMAGAGFVTVAAFYIFVDLFSVVLVEQFWSLANSVTGVGEGRKSYWFVASGGLTGGIIGGLLSSALVRHTSMETADLLLSCAALLLVCGAANLVMGRSALFRETNAGRPVHLHGDGLRAVAGNRYLLMIAAIVCLSQLVAPVVEFQFLRAIHATYDDVDRRTEFIGNFFAVMGFVSLGVNFILTPLVHRHLGVIAGLTLQPVVISLMTLAYASEQTLGRASVLKIADRGLSYSINRASKEILYIPIDAVVASQAKAWIDMLGYRLFKVLGSGIIILATSWVPAPRVATDLCWITLMLCGAWVAAVLVLGAEQRRLLPQSS